MRSRVGRREGRDRGEEGSGMAVVVAAVFGGRWGCKEAKMKKEGRAEE